uniref:Beta galactosidase small chain/ domain-containing protein n=1 Tax=Bionectria ochroleuca TaxID=29856 RepID=A0A0B7KL00_BIOOC
MFNFNLIDGGLGPERGLYRTLTQNDHGFAGDGKEWLKFRLSETKMHSWFINEDYTTTVNVNVRVAPVLEWSCTAELTYTLGIGNLSARAVESFSGTAPTHIPRLGLMMSLPRYDSATWLG